MLDRDGVLNETVLGSYVTKWRDFRWIPGSREALVMLRDAGVRLSIVTNQAVIRKGLASSEQIDNLHRRMLAEVCPPPLTLQDIYVCPHVEADECDCRKPRSGLLLRALHDHEECAESSLLIGDSWRDAKAAESAGVQFVLVYTGNGRNEVRRIREEGLPYLGTFESLFSAVSRILGKD